MVWEALIPAAAAVVGSLLTSKGSQSSQQVANTTNIELNQANRDWMAQMSNTSYQRAVADMQAAGLNPMLAYQQGGASTPTSTAPVVQPVIGGAQTVGQAVGSAVSGAKSGVEIMQGFQQVQQSEAATRQMDAATEKIKSETMTRDLNTAKLIADVDYSRNIGAKALEDILAARYGAQSAQMQYRAMMNEPELRGTGFAADVAKRKAEAQLSELEVPKSKAEAAFYENAFGKAAPYLQQLFKMIPGVSSAVSVMKR